MWKSLKIVVKHIRIITFNHNDMLMISHLEISREADTGDNKQNDAPAELAHGNPPISSFQQISGLKSKLLGGFNHLEKYEFVNGKDYPIYEMENKIHVWNHQPALSKLQTVLFEIMDETSLQNSSKLQVHPQFQFNVK